MRASAFAAFPFLARKDDLAILDWPVFVIVRAITYASLFIALMFVYLPARFLAWSRVTQPAHTGMQQIAGMTMAGLGAVLALWCVVTFVVVGKGTPAPFDPPRRLVTRGPYRLIRNPMYFAAGIALCGLALFYVSWSMLIYAGLFLIAAHLFVIWYEEPTLRRSFGEEYDLYCEHVGRWVLRVR